MKSHDLAKLLLANPNVDIVLQKDAEGNGFEPLRGADFDCILAEDNSGEMEIYAKSDEPEDYGLSVNEWKKLKESGSVVILFP